MIDYFPFTLDSKKILIVSKSNYSIQLTVCSFHMIATPPILKTLGFEKSYRISNLQSQAIQNKKIGFEKS